MARFSIASLRNKHLLALVGNAIMAVLGVLMMALLTRSLDKTSLGTWFLFLTIYSLGDAVRNGFLGTAAVKFYAGTNAERGAQVLGSVWYLALAITGLLVLADGVGFLFLGAVNNEQVAVTIKWFGLTFLSSLPFSLIFWILVAEEKYGKVLLLRLVNSGSMILVIGGLIWTNNMTLNTLLWCNFLTNCLTSIVGMAWGLGRFGTITKRTKETTLEIYHFGKFSLASTAVSKLFCNVDNLIINFMLGPAALAIYSLPIKLMELIEFPLRTFVGTGMSAMAVAYNQKDTTRTTYIFNKFSGMLTIAFIPVSIGVFFLADVAISILGGAQYAGTEAANVYRILMVIAILYPIDRFIGVTLDIIHKPNINFYKVIVMLVFAVVGDFAGIAIFNNIYGIGLASFFVVSSGLVYGYYHLRKYLDFTIGGILTAGVTETKLLFQKFRGMV